MLFLFTSMFSFISSLWRRLFFNLYFEDVKDWFQVSVLAEAVVLPYLASLFGSMVVVVSSEVVVSCSAEVVM